MLEANLGINKSNFSGEYPTGWTRLADCPVSVHYHSLVAREDNLYLFGGGGPPTINTIFKYSILENTWTELFPNSPLPIARFYHTAVIINDKMLIHGGTHVINTNLSDLWEYDFNTNTWTRKQGDEVTRQHSSVVLNDRLVSMGGAVKSTVLEYNPQSNSWIKLPSLPYNVYNLAAESYLNSIYVYGGASINSTYYYQLLEFNKSRNTWVQKSGRSPARHGHSLVRINDHLYSFGGINASGFLPRNYTFTRYGLISDTWEELVLNGTEGVDFPSMRYAHASCRWNNSFFISGGSGANAGKDLWVYTP